MVLWSSAGEPAQRQFDRWRSVICQEFVPLTPTRTVERPDFPSRVESRALGSLNRAEIRSCAQYVAHGPAEVASASGGYYFVNLQLAGRCVVRVGREESVLDAGQFTVLDTTAPYYLGFASDWRMLSFRIPRDQLAPRLPDPRRGTGTRIDGRHGPGRVVAGLMRSLWRLDQRLDQVSETELGQAVMGTVAVALGAAPASTRDDTRAGTRAVARAEVMRFVLANLADPDLSVRLVCRQFHISPRSLHGLFADQERTFGQIVRETRLDECARLLSAAGPGVSVTSIAARHGFADPAGFSRAFRRRFGVAPREVLGRPDRLAQLGVGPARKVAVGS